MFEAEGMASAGSPGRACLGGGKEVSVAWAEQGQERWEISSDGLSTLSLEQGFPNLSTNQVRAQENTSCGGPTPRVSNIPIKFPDDVDAAGLGPTLWEPLT